MIFKSKAASQSAYDEQRIKDNRLRGWHPFFAIIPRRVSTTEIAAFELIERRGEYIPRARPGDDGHWTWQYRRTKPPASKRATAVDTRTLPLLEAADSDFAAAH